MAQKEFVQLTAAVEKLKKRWPKPPTQEVEELFAQIEKNLSTLKAGKKGRGRKGFFDFVGLVQQVLKIHDILFLNRHLTYHVTSTSDLPQAAGSEEEALTVLTELLDTTARQAAFGSRLDIHIQAGDRSEGPAIQTKLVYEGKPLSDLDRQRFIEEVYGTADKETADSGMASAKNILRHAGGQFWLEFPKETCVALTFNWPAAGGGVVKRPGGVATYKYDIWLAEYSKIRQRFGIPKTNKLMTQIETYIRSLVRHPMDIVIAFPNRGMVTAIYESQEGAASSVAGRISERLRKESFRIGKKNITPKFRYQLTDLT